ncbi:GMC family oxidoreductase [Hoeflea sp.]|uniref:GMC family oxidoreductase n=1 Tax=Hoeflea sp. TaxID=1940281 RepID=UPI003A93AFC3
MSRAGQSEDYGTYDYVIVGAGSAGCVVANRLSANPRNRVLVIEAGGLDRWIWFHIPAGYLFAIGNPRADWMFRTTEQAGLGGRSLNYPRGKVIGGSSAINAMIYMRGQAADYDSWETLGLPGWGWNNVLPHFLKSEDHMRPPNEFHRSGGEWRVEYPRMRWEILDSFRDAAEQQGVAKIDDFNGGDNEGSSYFQVNQKGGWRFSAARAFLKPVLHRSNLHLITGAEAEKVLFDGKKATGLQFRHEGRTRAVRAEREVILASGAIGSPWLLEKSGVGQGERLRAAGIEVVSDLPGLGENLQDHLQIRPVYKVSNVRTLNTDYWNLFRRLGMGLDFAFRRRGPLTMAPSQLGLFARSGPDVERADLQFHIQPLSLDAWGAGLHRFGAITASVCNLRPTSRGSVHYDPAKAMPVINPNYLSTDRDREVAVRGLRLARQIAGSSLLGRYALEEIKPGPEVASDEDLAHAAGDLGTTIFHPVGSARMGSDDDRLAVVDARLRVRGVSGLRVIDASVMPLITSGNTNAPSVMIGEKGAAMVLEDSKEA